MVMDEFIWFIETLRISALFPVRISWISISVVILIFLEYTIFVILESPGGSVISLEMA